MRKLCIHRYRHRYRQAHTNTRARVRTNTCGYSYLCMFAVYPGVYMPDGFSEEFYLELELRTHDWHVQALIELAFITIQCNNRDCEFELFSFSIVFQLFSRLFEIVCVLNIYSLFYYANFLNGRNAMESNFYGKKDVRQEGGDDNNIEPFHKRSQTIHRMDFFLL